MAQETRQGIGVDAQGNAVIDPALSGIYQILNTANGRRYIGSAVSLRRRRYQHFSALTRGLHCNRKLQAAWNRYGADSFTFQILLVCVKEDLLFFEQRCLDRLRPPYNLSPVAGSQLGYKFTPEAIVRMAARPIRRWSETEKAKVSASMQGREKTAEHLANISAALLGNKCALGCKRSEETKVKMSIAKQGRKQSPQHRANNAAARRGKKLSDEHKANLSIAGKRYYAQKRLSGG
ncbi:MAG TPA: GIY-YIG nuclease family protein [Pyrinomonadaceae bacterium]|nr:GIY-YIG nuclease family protein [Pyrinomonadaceae bacterium]